LGRKRTILIEMANIILTTLNAKFIHSAFGLRYLYANLGDLQPEAAILEFDINQRPIDIVEAILARKPQIVGLGVYIWNVIPTTEVVSLLRRVAPHLKLVLGGPEVSYEWEHQEIVQLADYVIPGEADLAFGELCRKLMDGVVPEHKLVKAALPDMAGLKLPYSFYDQRDVDHRVIYVEASRGCPFTCEFCLSSLDIPVRQIPLEPLLNQFEDLLSRGVTQFKFVDRTFNLNIATGKRLLSFFRERYREGMFLHFEMIPDRLPEALRELISWFPPGSLQFEIGIQTLNNEVGERIRRRQDLARTVENFRFLREKTGVHIHADLIVGLPGETMESFGRGFDQLLSWGPQEIQVGILKRLRGTPIARHDEPWSMVYSDRSPYEVLQTGALSFETLQRLRRFARYWDLVANSGNFVESVTRIWHGGASAFDGFLRWSDWLWGRISRTHGIALTRLSELLFDFLTEELRQNPKEVAGVLRADYERTGRFDLPPFLRDLLPGAPRLPRSRAGSEIPKRQARHRPDSASP
jgi:radical SAM superfamily enzyme YgiQ (UPF0313 family)